MAINNHNKYLLAGLDNPFLIGLVYESISRKPLDLMVKSMVSG